MSVGSIENLDVIFDCKLNFYEHIIYTVNKSLHVMFNCRSTKEFRFINILKTLYFCLVRSTLMYASSAWLSYYAKYIERLEIVQRHFFRIVASKFGFSNPFINHNCKTVTKHLKIPILQSLRRSKDLLFLYETV